MLRHYLKLAFRNLSRQKAFSFINIAGLATGLACSMIILLWVQDEMSFDGFHANAGSIYRLVGDAGELQVAISPAPLGPALQNEFPEIINSTRLRDMEHGVFEANDHKFEETRGFYAEASFFQVFDFKMLSGNPLTALKQPDGIVISESLARKYFGTVDAIGMTLRVDGKDVFKVTGILEDAFRNSHLQFDLLLPWAYLATVDNNIKNNIWDNFNYYTYFVLEHRLPGPELKKLETKVDEFYKVHEKVLKINYHLQPLADIHLHSKLMADVPGHGNEQYVRIFIVVAVFVLLVACINFMNLSTARSARRAKEVGLRKVAGAVRIQLIGQFLGETLLICLLSLVLALGMVYFALPVVNNEVGKHLSLDFHNPVLVFGFLGITLITGLLSGSYPALFLSAFVPIKVLKKDIRTGAGGVVFRNVLVVAQFVISIVLLVGTAIVHKQLTYIRNKNLGFDKENLIYTTLRDDVGKKVVPMRAALASNPLTANFTITNDLPTNLVSGTIADWPGKEKSKQVIFSLLFVDDGFIPLFQMNLLSGRNFNKDGLGDTSNFIVNEKAMEIMGFNTDSVIGQEVTVGGDEKGRIVGVVKNFNFKPLQEAIEPLALRFNTWAGVVVVKANPQRTTETIAALEKAWGQLNTLYPFVYKFVDQDLENLYRSEKQIGSLFTVFAFLAIFISCLGLYGLSAFIVEQRTKEIGIRKTLGASLANIAYLLTRKFVIPVLVAMVIAAPLAYFAMEKWLENFAYKITFSWLLFLLAGALAVLISLLTVSYESIKAARVNPTRSLRDE